MTREFHVKFHLENRYHANRFVVRAVHLNKNE